MIQFNSVYCTTQKLCIVISPSNVNAGLTYHILKGKISLQTGVVVQNIGHLDVGGNDVVEKECGPVSTIVLYRFASYLIVSVSPNVDFIACD